MAQMNIRIDDTVKAEAEMVLEDIGLSMSAAITVFLKAIGRERRIPFELTADPFYAESNIKYLEKIKQDIDAGKARFAEHELIEVE